MSDYILKIKKKEDIHAKKNLNILFCKKIDLSSLNYYTNVKKSDTQSLKINFL